MFFADVGADAQSVVPPVSFEAVCFAGAVQFIVGVALKLSDKTGFQVNVDLAVTGGGFIAGSVYRRVRWWNHSCRGRFSGRCWREYRLNPDGCRSVAPEVRYRIHYRPGSG